MRVDLSQKEDKPSFRALERNRLLISSISLFLSFASFPSASSLAASHPSPLAINGVSFPSFTASTQTREQI